MTRQTRPAINPQPPSVKNSRSIVGFYEVGEYVRRRYQVQLANRPTTQSAKHHVYGIALEVAEHYQISRSMVDHAHRFAQRYSLAEAKQLSRFRTKDNKRLNRGHLIALQFVPRQTARILASKCCKKG